MADGSAVVAVERQFYGGAVLPSPHDRLPAWPPFLVLLVALIGRKRWLLGVAVLVAVLWRPLAEAYREHRYDRRWRQQPLGW
ncbi:hypothetical protein ACQEVB_03380 [Pseudonocardia sp. CA-107938]|uniref:hypothetical protein n=1 Tax=Pseudonocardia sp. CA-107938 TaxID=3240021 RepID=UPI003D8A1C25